MVANRELTVVLADDDDGHAELIREGLLGSGLTAPVFRFSSGKELWNFLNGETVYGMKRNPGGAYVLLLDIHLPGMDGTEVLSKMKSRDDTRGIPVIMLSMVDDPAEIERCYGMGCCAYISKPVEFPDFAENLRRLGLFLQIISV